MASLLRADTDAPRASRDRRARGQGLAWGLLAVAVYFLWPASMGGGTSLVIVSGQSMEPTYSSGDLIVARKGEPQIGDVIVYAPSSLGGAQVVHRIIAGDAESGWILQGDNNNFVDPFYPVDDEVRGIVHIHVPRVSAVTSWLLNPLMWLGVILVGMVVALWPSEDDDDEDDEDDDEEPVEHPVDSDSEVAANASVSDADSSPNLDGPRERTEPSSVRP